jgi:hypothetical protein
MGTSDRNNTKKIPLTKWKTVGACANENKLLKYKDKNIDVNFSADGS